RCRLDLITVLRKSAHQQFAYRLLVLGDQNPCHRETSQRPASARSVRCRNRTMTSEPSSGGEASRLRKVRISRAPSESRGSCAVHAYTSCPSSLITERRRRGISRD